ncbi:MAG: hypothetical protein ABIQ39_15100 [Ilumatobacteraceae bacterium]
MTVQRRRDEHLAGVVERSRARAAGAGELRPWRVGPIDSAFTDEARQLVADWRRDGGYDRALAEIAAADPALAVQ